MDQRSKTTSQKNGIRVQCKTENFVPIVVPGLSTSSSSGAHPSTSMTLSRQESHHPTSTSSSSSSPTTTVLSDREIRDREDQSGIDSSPVPVSSSNVEEMIERCNPLFAVKPITSTPKPTKNHPKTHKEETTTERGNPLFADSGRAPLNSEIREWVQEFRENLVDARVPERRDSHARSSHESSLEPTRSVNLGKRSVYTHFPQDGNCEICQRTQHKCRRRNGGAVPRAENFGVIQFLVEC